MAALSQQTIQYRLEKCLQSTLRERVPGMVWHVAVENP